MPRILIAEDDDDTRQTVRDLLRSNGYDVLEATDGGEALDLVKSAKPDALVLDIIMPRMEGWEVVEKIRGQNSNLPILVLSALQSEEDLVRALDAGADDYVEKPYRTSELLARLRAIVRRGPKSSGPGNGVGAAAAGSQAETGRQMHETPVESE